MPSLRVLLVRLFPKVLGSTQHATDKYYAHNVRGQGVAIASADPSNEPSTTGQHNKNGIMYSQSYSVQHGSGWESDETSLVQLSNLDAAHSKSREGQKSDTEG